MQAPGGTRDLQAAARRDLVRQARVLMREHLADPDFNLPDAARELYVSCRHLQRSFAQSGSKGFRHELANMRVREAARMLHENPSLSVAVVAHAVGYRQAPYFAKAFRMHLNMLPGEWRQTCRARRSAQTERPVLLAA